MDVKGFDGFYANYGNSYSLSSGIFTAPIPGVYEFSISMRHTDTSWNKIQIKKKCLMVC